MSQPRLLQVTADYKQHLLHHEAQATQALASAHQHILAVIEQRLAALYRDMAAKQQAGGHIPVSWLYEADRLQKVKHFIIEQLNHYGLIAAQATQHLQEQAVLFGQQLAQAQIQTLVGREMVAPPSPAVLANLIGATQKGSPLADLFHGFGQEAAKGVSEVLIRGVTLGSGVQTIAKDVQQALDISRQRALTIARSETMRAFNSAAQDRYQASGLVTKYRRIAAKSPRTCAACLALDGTLYDLDEDFAMHPNDRCTMIPVLDSETEQYQSGADWLQEQDAAVQQQVLGSKAAYALYRDGKASLQDFAGIQHDKDWGPSIFVKPVKDLKKAG